MSLSNYTRIENTVVSGSSLVSNLSGADVNALRFQSKVTKNDTITLTGAGYNLTSFDFVEAVVSRQLVNGFGLTASRALYLGPDAASQAAAYVLMFDLASGVGAKILLNFEVPVIANAAYAVTLANGVVGTPGATNAYVKVLADADLAGTSYTKPLFAASAISGTHKTVEVWATNVTEGSEAVSFNVLSSTGN